jgi:hypothetical protein
MDKKDLDIQKDNTPPSLEMGEKKIQKQKKELKKAITKRLLEESQVRLTPQAAEIAAESSNEIGSLNDQIKEYEFIIEYLDKATSVLNQVGWDIKNIIEIQKLEQL